MSDLFESDEQLRHMRACIERYGFVPLMGCACGCWKKPDAAKASLHLTELCAQNAIRERREGFRGTVGFRHRDGHMSHRPYWMLVDIASDPSDMSFCLVFHDEMVVVRGRDLRPLIEQVAASEPVIIADHDAAREEKPRPGAPLVDSIQSYRKRSSVLKRR